MNTPKRPEREKKSTSRPAYGILNAYEELWTPMTFGTSEEAEAYLEKKKGEFVKIGNEYALTTHRVVEVKIVYKYPK